MKNRTKRALLAFSVTGEDGIGVFAGTTVVPGAKACPDAPVAPVSTGIPGLIIVPGASIVPGVISGSGPYFPIKAAKSSSSLPA